MTTRTPGPSAVNLRWVALFYGIAFGGATVVALATFGVRHWLGPAAAIPALVMTAVLYMPMPLVAGLVVERASGRRPLIADEWRALRTSFWRTYARNAAATVLAIAAVVVTAGLIAWLAGALAVPGAGHLVTSDADFHDRMVQTNPALAGTPLPPLVVFVPMVLAQGILAGLTVNGLFAFGEEYGWRGVLAGELRPLGAVRANLLTGVLWGLWHAPIIILMGHNYGSEWGWGVLVMVAWGHPVLVPALAGARTHRLGARAGDAARGRQRRPRRVHLPRRGRQRAGRPAGRPAACRDDGGGGRRRVAGRGPAVRRSRGEGDAIWPLNRPVVTAEPPGTSRVAGSRQRR